MTPTPREDTMTKQTEQEAMDPWAKVRPQLLSGRIAYYAEEVNAARAADAAKIALLLEERAVRRGRRGTRQRFERLETERDALAAQVRERDAQIARLSAQVEDAEQRYRVTYTSLCDQAAQAVTLRAERDAAQQEIETFWTEVERGYDIEPRAFFEKEAVSMGFTSPIALAMHHMWKRDVKDRDGQTIIGAAQHTRLQQQIATLTEALTRYGRHQVSCDSFRSMAEVLRDVDTSARCSCGFAALQSTRPQEQP